MNVYFPQLGVAVVARKTRPQNATFVGYLSDKAVYVIPAKSQPRNTEVARGVLGGWNYEDGFSVHIVFGKTETDMHRYRFRENGRWLVKPQEIDGGFVGLIQTYTGVPLSAGVTPVVLK
jgi:hypothetical protein